MMSNLERVDAALAILEADQAQSIEPPATVIMPPDSGDFIIGNAEGFVRLAIASLRAAKGEKQSFKEPLLVVICLVVGLGTIIRWAMHVL